MLIKKIPLLDLNNISAIKENNNLNALKLTITELGSYIKKINREIIDRNNRKSSWTKELEEFKKIKNKDTTETKYIGELKNKIVAVENQIKELGYILNQKNTQLQSIHTNLNNRTKHVGDKLKTDIDKFHGSDLHIKVRTSVHLYNNIFTNVISKNNSPGHEDYRMYNKLWDQYIHNKSKLSNITNIHIIAVLTQSNIINQLKKDQTASSLEEYKNDMKTLDTLYNNIFKFLTESSMQLKKKYSYENIFLRDELDIIVHCVKHIIFSNFYHAILRSVMEYAKMLTPSTIMNNETDKTHITNSFGDDKKKLIKKENTLKIYNKKPEDYAEYIGKIVDRIVQYNYDDKTANADKKTSLKDYIVDDMPLISVKMILDIYEDKHDEHRKIPSLDDLFDKVVTILENNPVLPVNADSSLSKNIKDYILPYYKDVLNQIVPNMKKVLDNYKRYILNEERYIKMMGVIIEKSIKEMD
jgi:DNA repair exonuclease SbcCD ATPase subunit